LNLIPEQKKESNKAKLEAINLKLKCLNESLLIVLSNGEKLKT